MSIKVVPRNFSVLCFSKGGFCFGGFMDKKLIVLKVGTSSLTKKSGETDNSKIENIIRQICALKNDGHNVILVSSGAIAAGYKRLGFAKRPSSIADKQACAAVGQGLLMEEYSKLLLQESYPAAQLLLTRDDFVDRRRYKNAFNAIEVLLSRNAVPIINENDTISIEELKLGDNDTLSAQVAAMVHADLLILLTDIDGLYTGNPKTDESASRIPVVEKITPEIEQLAGGAGSSNATGGMVTKINGAKLATSAGVPVVICSSKQENSVIKAVEGTADSTYFKARKHNMKTKLQWMAFYAKSKGNLYVDDGACKALLELNKSLLPSGIVAVEGDFKSGDVVRVFRQGSHEYIGKGICEYSKDQLTDIIGTHGKHSEAINRNNWVEG